MKPYPANLWLTYRTVRYRPAALAMFVAKGGWGPEYVSKLGKRLVTMAARFPVLNPKTQYYKLPIPSVSEIPPIPEPGIPVPGRDHLKPQPPQLRAS